MKNKLFLLSIVVILTLALGAAASAETASKYYNGYYCASGPCGVDSAFVNAKTGYSGYYCTANYIAPFQAEFIRDVTYPDGTYVMPGSTFVKTWRLRNVGTQAWTTDMKLVLVGGDLTGNTTISMPYYVAPGYTVDISVTLTAPAYAANVNAQWMIQAPDGTLFGVGCNGATPIWVSVTTWTNGGCSCLGYTYCACAPCTGSSCSTTATSNKSGRNPYCNNKIRAIEDVTIPDGTVVAPGATFRKTWRMKNGGTCVWDEKYVVTFFYGDDLGYNGNVSISTEKPSSGTKYNVNRPTHMYVNPGEYVYISIDLTAPTTPGVYETYFKLRDNLGYEFGFGSYADSAFWVNIIVDDGAKSVDEGEAGTITKSIDQAEVITNDEIALENTQESEAEAESDTAAEEVLNKCSDQAIAMRATDAGYEVIWSAVNAGTNAWENYSLIKSDSNAAVSLEADEIPVPTTASGETAEISFNITLDESVETEDPLWLEFYMTDGNEGFCEFYFEAPAK